MDIIGYVFLGVAVIALITGLVKGFAHTLLALISVAGAVAVATIFTPKVCKLEFVKNLIEDTPIVINGQEMFYLRTVIVFFALFLLTLIAVLAMQGLFKAILNRAKALKFIDRLLGGVFNVAVTWAVFGIVYFVCHASTEWLVEIEQQLAQAGFDIGLAQAFGELTTIVNGSQILQMVYSTFNPIGELVGGLLFA